MQFGRQCSPYGSEREGEDYIVRRHPRGNGILDDAVEAFLSRIEIPRDLSRSRSSLAEGGQPQLLSMMLHALLNLKVSNAMMIVEAFTVVIGPGVLVASGSGSADIASECDIRIVVIEDGSLPDPGDALT
jgi:hypothetical protein